MRFISIATVLSAALLPAANARPACRPDRSTTSGESATTAATTTATIVETSSVDTATTLDVSTTYETTSALETTIVESATDETTNALETTITISESATLDSTALILTTTAETTSVEIATTTTEAATTTTAEAAGPAAFVKNGGFEENPNTVWNLQNSGIKSSPGSPYTGSQYLEFTVANDYATGLNLATQTVTGLSTDRQYRLSFYATVFSTPAPVLNAATLCFIQTMQGNTQISLSKLDFTNLNSYQAYNLNFTPVGSEFQLKLALRCTNGQKVTLAVGVDDVSIAEVV
ncbi:hypothetical protein FSPOR_3164 [Fusarium sporotrichioides]|uniref:CBM-cenC domain-containing protein n=1 Tax=Fusarium sporotrichioides TaxID=5514 RepID=A0A395SHD3_FUSSP|nr:hypothetical protein FSPOR_3164 [Fusarium sporotrichioides]